MTLQELLTRLQNMSPRLSLEVFIETYDGEYDKVVTERLVDWRVSEGAIYMVGRSVWEAEK